MKLRKKIGALLLVICLIIMQIPTSAFATGETTSLKFNASQLENCTVTYALDGGEATAVDPSSKDGGGAVWINDIPDQATVTITVSDGYEATAYEGEEDTAGPAYGATRNGQTYVFVADSKHEIYRVEVTGNQQGGPGEDNSATISLGDQVLVEKNEVKEFDIQGVEINENGEFLGISLDGYEGENNDLKISGSGHIGILIGEGTTKLNSILLGDGVQIDMDGRTSGTLSLKEGFKAENPEKPANSLDIGGSFLVKIGSEEQSATTAFEGIGNVSIRNYEFHERDRKDNVIYANKAFQDVDKVTLISSKMDVYAERAFECSETDSKTTFYLKTEGQVTFNGNEMGDVKLFSSYYFKYPEGPVNSEDMDHSCNVPSCMRDYEIENIENTLTEENRGCRYTVSGTAENTCRQFVSLDPILYSVSYQIDEGIEFPNPDKGSVTMNGFNRGFYMLDGTGERFEAWIAAGETVNVTILPEPGYQYQKDTLNINGQIIENTTPGEERGTYRFEMFPASGHICAGFAKTEDIINVDAQEIKGADIANADQVIENGNAKLDVSNATVSKEDESKIATAAGESEIEKVLDIDLTEVVVKNYDPTSNDNETWDTEKHNLDAPVSVSLTLDKNTLNSSSYIVVREHEGVAEVIESNYDEKTGLLSFTTDRFSTYAICANKEIGSQDTCNGSHKENTRIDKATTEKDGKIETYCTVCSKVLKTTVIKKIEEETLSYTKVTYTGREMKPVITVKDSAGEIVTPENYVVTYSNHVKVGKAVVTIVFTGNYQGTVQKTFTINPKATTVSKVKSAKKKLSVTVKKQKTQVKGYEVQVSTNKKFSKNVKKTSTTKTSVTIKGLKAKKKYYVRVRTYKTVKGVKYYSAWKNYSKSVKTK